MHRHLTIGTRGSPLALVQAKSVEEGLRQIGIDSTIHVITTTGDHVLDRPLAEIGGKGLFTKEIDDALLNGQIDLAVHSMKDVPTFLPEGIEIVAMLPRADERDALISRERLSLCQLPKGAVIGTSSLRRHAQLKAKRPDLMIVPLRGNVATRMRKVEQGELDATLLAMAGLNRLGSPLASVVPLNIDEMLPAVGQGAIGIACRETDAKQSTWNALNHEDTSIRVKCERSVLARINGDCKTPVGVLARFEGKDRLVVRATLGHASGDYAVTSANAGERAEYMELGDQCGQTILADTRSHQILDASIS